MLIEILNAEEARVLGTLLEKSLATPDYYPMTLNALRTACNQKSNRDPVTEYDDSTITAALAGLKRKCLVTFIPYGSHGQNKYRHFLEDPRFNLHKADLAVLAVLLLRGSQTLNEVRLRASSLHPVEGLEEAEALLKALAARPEPLAELLPKRPGWKEPRWRDTLREHGAETATADASEADDATPGPVTAGTTAAARTATAESRGPGQGDELEELKREVAGLKADIASLREAVEKIRADLY